MRYKDRLIKIKEGIKMPWHFFSHPQGNPKMTMLTLQSPYKEQLEFTGPNIFEAIKTAEEYLEHEQKVGALHQEKEIKNEEKSEKEETETEEKSKIE